MNETELSPIETRLTSRSPLAEDAAAHRIAGRKDVLGAVGREPVAREREALALQAWLALGWLVGVLRSIKRHPAWGFSAASLAVLGGVLAFWSSVAGPAPLVYAELVKPLMNATSGRFDAVVRVNGEETMRQESYFAGDLVRVNMAKDDRSASQIMDISKDLALHLDHNEKHAVLLRVGSWMSDEEKLDEKKMIAKYGGGFLGGFRAMLDPANQKKAAKEGHTMESVEKTLSDGTELRGFRGSRPDDDGYIEIWANPETGEPAEFVMRVPTWPAGQESVLTDFEFNVPVDPALFSMKAPEGYAFEDKTAEPLESASDTAAPSEG